MTDEVGKSDHYGVYILKVRKYVRSQSPLHWITARNLSDLSCLQHNVWRYLHKCEEGFDQHSSLKTFNELQKKKRLNECFQDLLMVSINFMNDNLQVFFKSINSMAVGKASTSRKCRILQGLRS